MKQFRLTLQRTVDDSYDIEIGRSLLARPAEDLAAGLLPFRRFALITDDNVLPLCARPVFDRLVAAGFEGEIFSFPAGEASKTRETKAALEDRMLAAGFRRDCFVLAVGGGVVSDLAGFLAGTYARGVPFLVYATTLLSAADASVGGKTAVDTPLATNLIGLFHQPKKVYIDLDCWATLPPREFAGGLAETIKHACLAGTADPAAPAAPAAPAGPAAPADPAASSFFEYLEANLDRILARDPAACEHIAFRNCEIKYHVVMRDERESGLREILNLGHTVGRAAEILSADSPGESAGPLGACPSVKSAGTPGAYRLLHGEAVAIGLCAACALAVRLGTMTAGEAGRVRDLLRRAALPVSLPDYIDREALVRRLYTDKKVRNGRLRFVIPSGLGAVVESPPGVFAREISEETAREMIMEL